MNRPVALLLAAAAAATIAGRSRADVKGLTLGITVNCPYALAG
jgi:hypothetical protein